MDAAVAFDFVGTTAAVGLEGKIAAESVASLSAAASLGFGIDFGCFAFDFGCFEFDFGCGGNAVVAFEGWQLAVVTG